MSFNQSPSRRLFLKQATAMSALGAAAPMALNLAALGSASASGAPDYKALVCVYLQGGNDGFNTVLPTDSESWANYTAVRNQAPDSIALLKDVAANAAQTRGSPAWLGGVLPIAPLNNQGRSFALHPLLTGLRDQFNTKQLAILSNIGTLVEPLSKEDYAKGSKKTPSPLFSHNDQSSQWLAMAAEGARRGWGGKLADLIASDNQNSSFTAISAAGNSVWLYGDQVKQYHLSANGAIRFGYRPDSGGVNRLMNSTAAVDLIKKVATVPTSNHLLMRDLADVHASSIQAESVITQNLPSAEASPFGPSASVLNYDSVVWGNKQNNVLAQQLQSVARMIKAGPAMGLKRQIFFVSLGGFDTHDQQNLRHAELMAQLNHALVYFQGVISQLGLANQVTTFTASDFGRAFTSNGDGTDHGWGSHQFVLGGAVKGGDIYGTFPRLGAKNVKDNGFDSSADQLYNGTLLPKQSVGQLGATLGNWLKPGSASVLADSFPSIKNFGNAIDLGFMTS
jgi:uncharacterized protein (DUF1501 family)